jgi:Flp pilus assembly protein TadG
MIIKVQNILDRAAKFARTLAKDNRGVAAVEFAFIAPLLITLYLGTMEVSGLLQMNKKIGRAASTSGDLIALSSVQDLTQNQIKPILGIGAAVTQPYNLTKPIVTASGIDIDSGGVAKIAWSLKYDGSTLSAGEAKNTVVTVPARVTIASTSLVKVEAKIQYRTLTSWTIKPKPGDSFGSINMSEVYYYRPRIFPKINCTDC